MIGWRKSSKCEANTCVEVYLGHRQVRVRSTHNTSVTLRFTPDAWRAFIAHIGKRVGP